MLVVDGGAALLLATEQADQDKQGEEEAGPARAEPAAEEGGGKLKHIFIIYLSYLSLYIF